MSTPTVQRRRVAPRPVHPASAPGNDVFRSSLSPEPPAIGRFRCDGRGESWWWSPEMFALHGLPPDGAEPCIQLLLDRQHPADRSRTAESLVAACSGRPFSLEVRVPMPGSASRALLLAGEPQRAHDGTVVAVEGLCIDVTHSRRDGAEDLLGKLQAEVEQMRTAMASRATIEQAKGILMLLTNCGDQVAFQLLAHISSHTHRKVREVALAITDSASGHGRLPQDICAILQDACPPPATPG